MKWQVGMESKQNGKLTKWQDDQNSKLTKWKVDEMSS